MSNLQASFSVVFPLFFLMALGYGMRAAHLWDDPVIRKVNKLVFQIFLPVNIFLNILRSDLSSTFRPRMVIFSCVTVLVLFILLCGIIPLIEKTPARRGVMIQGIMRSNFVVLGTSVVASVYGETGTALAASLITFVIPMFNVLSVIALEIHRTDGGHADPKRVALGIIKNPLILACIAGMLAALLRLQLPEWLASPLNSLSGLSTPLALLTLGGSFYFSRVRSGLRQLITVILGRLLIVPAAVMVVAVALGFRNAELMTLVAIFACPTAISSYPMAVQQGGDGELAGQIVVFTSALSMASLFILIWILKSAGWVV